MRLREGRDAENARYGENVREEHLDLGVADSLYSDRACVAALFNMFSSSQG